MSQLSLICCSILIMAVFQTARASTFQYPASVNPRDCPNYPYCGQTERPIAHPEPSVYLLQYPANVNPATCPNYPYCGHTYTVQAHWNGPLAGGIPAAQYPAGVAPATCPNYPHCSDPSVSVQSHTANAAVLTGHAAHQQQDVLLKGGYTGDGDYHGEGLAEALAPGHGRQVDWNNYLQWTNTPVLVQAKTPYHNQYPAGVDASTCPGYPYC